MNDVVLTVGFLKQGRILVFVFDSNLALREPEKFSVVLYGSGKEILREKLKSALIWFEDIWSTNIAGVSVFPVNEKVIANRGDLTVCAVDGKGEKTDPIRICLPYAWDYKASDPQKQKTSLEK